jgi:hypothetical protein
MIELFILLVLLGIWEDLQALKKAAKKLSIKNNEKK